jgi:hypothetical protein
MIPIDSAPMSSVDWKRDRRGKTEEKSGPVP